jgi:hypothetical protein
MTLKRISALPVALLLATLGCGAPCGLGLSGHLPFSGDAPLVPCCGASVYQDIDLTSNNVQEADVENFGGRTGAVDAFLTDANCTTLFTGSYTGSVTAPLCKIFIGPVPAQTVSQRYSLPRARYRLFAQSWTTNADATVFGMEVGVWGPVCRIPTGP